MIEIIENTLVVKVEGRNIMLISGCLPTSGSSGVDKCMFLFMDKGWDDLEKSAVFWQDIRYRYELPLGKGGCCDIPTEALENDGYLYMGLIGRGDGVLQNSKALMVPLRVGTRTGNCLGGGRG